MKDNLERNKYDYIDPQLIGNSIFEVGVNEESILNSKIGDTIKFRDYLGLDIGDRKTKILPIIKGDIITYQFQKKYDTILMIEVLEHIHFRDWKSVLDKLKENLNTGGYLILSTPHNQSLSQYINMIPKDRYQIHTIFGINSNVFRHLLPNCKIKILRWVIWRKKGESHIWAFGRFVKRIIIRNYPVILSNLLIIWKKGD